MSDLTEKTLTECLRAIRAHTGPPLSIKPTHMIVPEHNIRMLARKWKLSRAKTIARIRRIFGALT